MIETEEQRRWWFATHPEYSWSRKGDRPRTQEKKKDESSKIDPKTVDAYVDRMLKYEDGAVADLLRSVKRNFGTEGERERQDQRLAQADRPPPPSDNGASGGAKDDEKKEATFWESLVLEIDDQLQNLESLLGVDRGLAHPSRKLARNLEKAGRPRPPGHHAHHIAPVYDSRFPEAVEARQILKDFGIGISSADNGAWLPGKPGIGSGAYHPALHSREYYRQVRDSLRQATTKQEAIQTLQRIGRQLYKGSFPK